MLMKCTRCNSIYILTVTAIRSCCCSLPVSDAMLEPCGIYTGAPNSLCTYHTATCAMHVRFHVYQNTKKQDDGEMKSTIICCSDEVLLKTVIEIGHIQSLHINNE